MIDFIDMKAEEDRAELMEVLRREVLRDSVKTSVIDMTPLGLVEMTRKKERRPLMEQIALKKINI
jgi:ribonuclease G